MSREEEDLYDHIDALVKLLKLRVPTLTSSIEVKKINAMPKGKRIHL